MGETINYPPITQGFLDKVVKTTGKLSSTNNPNVFIDEVGDAFGMSVDITTGQPILIRLSKSKPVPNKNL